MLFEKKKYSGNFAARKFRKFTEIFLTVHVPAIKFIGKKQLVNIFPMMIL